MRVDLIFLSLLRDFVRDLSGWQGTS